MKLPNSGKAKGENVAEAKKISLAQFMGQPDQYIAGIPQRDLTAEEWAKLPADRQELALKSGIYAIKYSKEKEA